MPPIRRPVTRPFETSLFHKRFQQNGPDMVPFFPISEQPADTQRKTARSQRGNSYVRKNQKTAITYNLAQILLPSVLIPPNPFIPGTQPPRCCAKGNSTDPSVSSTLYQITHLRAAQRPRSQIMMPVHQLIPYGRYLFTCTRYPDYCYRTKFRQITFYNSLFAYVRFVFCTNIFGPLLCPILKWCTCRQINNARTMEFQKRYPALHLFEASIRASPIKPSANYTRQLAPSYFRPLVNSLDYSSDNLLCKILPIDNHTTNIINYSLRVQQKMWDMSSS
jgi:hypothetical protein